MNRKRLFTSLIIFVLLTAGLIAFTLSKDSSDDRFVSYTVDAKLQDIAFYWKNDHGKTIQSIQNLKTFVESKNLELVFAMNGGMFNPDNSPKGLFVQQFKTLTPLDTSSGSGNFYLKPNGIFYIATDNTPVVCNTEDFVDNGKVKFATQSGPMLIVNGQIHPAFKDGSSNLHIRNGVGILPDNKIIFAMSKTEANFYEFATYFKSLGCENALYLDGFVSRTYLPEKNWIQTDGNFGVIVGVIKTRTND